MAVLTPASVFRRFEVDGVESSGKHKPEKAEIIQLLNTLFGTSRGGWVVAGTKAELDGVTPENETDGGVVLDDPTASNNGYYQRDSSAWVRERGFPDTFARVTLGGTANAQTGTVSSGVNPGDIEVFIAFVNTPNTGPMTYNGVPVVNAAGNPLSAGEWTGVVLFVLNSDGDYQLIIDAGAAAAAAASATEASGYADAAAASATEAANQVAGVIPTLQRFAVGAAVQSVDLGNAELHPNSVRVFIDGVYQFSDTWSMTGGVITPASGTWPGDGIVENMEVVIDATSAAVFNVPSNGSVSTDKILDGAVTTPKLADGAVTLEKLDDNVVSLIEDVGSTASFDRFRWPDFDVGETSPERDIAVLDENFHQGFGYCCRADDGRLYLCWRKGTEHGIAGAGSLVMKRMDNDGFSTVDVRTVVTPEAGRDLRDPMPVVTPTGRVVLVWCDTSATNDGDGTDDTFYRSMYSDDRGETWSAPVTIATIPFNYARVYGGLKVWPSTDPGRQWELGFTAYHQTGVGAWELTFYVSRDDGETFLSATDIGESVISPTSHNETSMDGVNASVWFAATRASDSIHLTYSTDGRQTWSAFATIASTVTGTHVAPSLDIVKDKAGRPWVLVGISDRTNDWLEFTAALASDIISKGIYVFPAPTKSFDTSNAYPSTVIYPDGNMLVSFTREFSGETYASYHLGYFSYGDLIERRGPFGFSAPAPTLDAGGTAVTIASSGSIPYTSSWIVVDTNGGASTDDLINIAGGREGDILILSSVSGSRDVVVKHGVDNIQLKSGADYTLGSALDRITLMKITTNWVEL